MDNHGHAHALIAWVRQKSDRNDVSVQWMPASEHFAAFVGRHVLSMQPTRELCEKFWPDEIKWLRQRAAQ